MGFRPGQVTRLLAGEGLLVALVGSLVGAMAGVGYAALMLLGLRTWWLPAIGTPFLTLHVSWQSPAIGLASGLVLALAAIWFSVRRLGRVAPRRLLAGSTERGRKGERGTRRSTFLFLPFSLSFCLLLFLAFAPAAILLFAKLGEQAQVGAFFARDRYRCSPCWRWSTSCFVAARPDRPLPAGEATCSAWPSATPLATRAAARWRSG